MAKPLAFTVIELLVVTLSGMVLLVAVTPELTDAQIREKCAQADLDMLAVAVALENYYADNNKYPVFGYEPQSFSIPGAGNPTATDPCARSNAGLTSPIAYLTAPIPTDPFGPIQPDDDYSFSLSGGEGYYYNTESWFNCRGFGWSVFTDPEETNPAKWVLQSKGPDGYFSHSVSTGIGTGELDRPMRYRYDPTNGTLSIGNIVRYGPQPIGTSWTTR